MSVDSSASESNSSSSSSSFQFPSLAGRVVFVTGGTGFVGRALISRLVSKEFVREIRALVRDPLAAEKLRQKYAESGVTVKPVLGSLDSLEEMKKGLEGADVVFHLAAHVSTNGIWAEFLKTTVRGTQNLIQAAQAAGIKRLVHCSTEAVLVGGPPIVDAKEDFPISTPDENVYPYTRSKAIAESDVRKANQPGKFDTIVVRPRFIWGRGDTVLLPKFTEAIRQGKLVWFSAGNYLTSTTHVQNVIEALILAATKGRAGEIYHVTDGDKIQVRDWWTRWLASVGTIAPASWKSLAYPVTYAAAVTMECASNLKYKLKLSNKVDPDVSRQTLALLGREVTLNDDKIRTELGFQNVITREEGLKEMKEDHEAEIRARAAGTHK